MTSIDDVIRLLEAAKNSSVSSSTTKKKSGVTPKKKRKVSGYQKRYGAAFKKLAPKFKTKSGKWKKDGFKRCAAAARRAAKK
tara:strand:+ start:694 stop:939 length:246 start_codon:yes stop_codon:yes gene_type:complete